MPYYERCEGLPTGPCPEQRQDASVRFGYGEMFLCRQCESARQPTMKNTNKLNTAAIILPEPTRVTRSSNVNQVCSKKSTHDDSDSEFDLPAAQVKRIKKKAAHGVKTLSQKSIDII